jgi:large subunit ribosomal protein L35
LARTKLKTHKGAKKRFKVTGTGKVVAHHAFARHILTSKKSNRKRKLAQQRTISDADVARVRAMLPYGS